MMIHCNKSNDLRYYVQNEIKNISPIKFFLTSDNGLYSFGIQESINGLPIHDFFVTNLMPIVFYL